MRIAVDALGGDNALEEIVAGTIAAARKLPDHDLLLVGDEILVRPLTADGPKNVRLKDARGSVGMGEEAAATLRARPDSSVAVAASLVRTGEVDVFFSAGSTGATVGAALVKVVRVPGCCMMEIGTILMFDKLLLLL